MPLAEVKDESRSRWAAEPTSDHDDTNDKRHDADFFSKFSSGRCDRFRQIFIQIGAILAIFRPFEVFGRSSKCWNA